MYPNCTLTLEIPNRNCYTIAWWLIVVFIFSVSASADSDDRNKEAVRQVWKPYCGLYCLYAAMKQQGVEVEFPSLIKHEYCGSMHGSALSELVKVAEDHGMHTMSAKNLTSRELRQATCPIILHVKLQPNSRTYAHYILYLGTREGYAIIYDPSNSIKAMPFHELVPRWDGVGLILSATPIDAISIFRPAYERFVLYVSIVAVFILFLRWVKQRWLSFSAAISRRKLLLLSAVQCCGLTLVALATGMLYHFANDEGFLVHMNATDSIKQAYWDTFISKISKNEVNTLFDTDTIFIDARFSSDFEAGHLKGAINVPINITDKERKILMANISKRSHIVVYCQSASCGYARNVTKKLLADGFRNVSIFKGGWREWAQNETN